MEDVHKINSLDLDGLNLYELNLPKSNNIEYVIVSINVNHDDYIFIPNKKYSFQKFIDISFDIIKLDTRLKLDAKISPEKLIKIDLSINQMNEGGFFLINTKSIDKIKNCVNLNTYVNLNTFYLKFPVFIHKSDNYWNSYYGMIDSFDKVYCLHINKDYNRLNNMLNIADMFNQSYDEFFWNGCFGYVVPDSDFLQKNDIIKIPLKQGEIGCNLSQQYILENALENKYENILLIEDDLKLSDNFFEVYHNLTNDIKDIDILQLGFSWNMNPDYSHLKIIKEYDNYVLAKSVNKSDTTYNKYKIGGLFCTQLSKKAIGIYLKENKPLKTISDVFIRDMFYMNKYDLNCYYIIDKNLIGNKRIGLATVNVNYGDSTTRNIKNSTDTRILDTNLFKYLIKIKKIQFKLKNKLRINIRATEYSCKFYNNIVTHIQDKFKNTLGKIEEHESETIDIFIYTDLKKDVILKKNYITSNDTLVILIKGEPHNSNPCDYDICIGEKYMNNIVNVPYPFLLSSLNEHRQLYKKFSVPFNTKKSYCFMYSVDNPTRVNIFNEFSKKVRVDALGKSCNNTDIQNTRSVYNDDETFYDIAVKIYSDYKFVLSIENTIKDYYFTEKLINPILANSIPLYYGSDTAFEIINKKRVIYFNDFKDIPSLIAYTMELLNDEDKYNEIINQPIFTCDKINLTNYNQIIYEKLDSVLGFAGRIFTDRDKYLLNCNIIPVKLNQEEEYYLKDCTFDNDLIEGFAQFKKIENIDSNNSLLNKVGNFSNYTGRVIINRLIKDPEIIDADAGINERNKTDMINVGNEAKYDKLYKNVISNSQVMDSQTQNMLLIKKKFINNLMKK